VPEIEIDQMIDFDVITDKFFRILKQFAPFGPGNMSPVFQSDFVVDTGNSRVVGKNHLKLELMQQTSRSKPFAGIAFQKGHLFDRIRTGTPFSICYHIEENEWMGKTNLQLNIKDIRFE
jgi:single-stranded-DNA-specific exonuclease